MSRTHRALAALLTAAALAGCAASGSSEALTTEPFGAAGAGEEALVNASFVATVGRGARGLVPGEWQISFREYGRMFVHHDGRVVYEGDYTVSGRELRIANRTGSYGCPGAPATYTWSLHQGVLELRRRSDPCPVTSRLFPGARWRRR